MRIPAQLVLGLFCAMFLTGCQTTGQNKWVSADQNNAASANETSTPLAPTISSKSLNREDLFEVGRNPYAYNDIPPNARPAPDTREAGLWYVIDKVEEKSKTAGNLIRDAALQQYIDDIVCNLAGPYCNDVRVYIQRIPAFNATMAANGMMSVWSGLLLRAQNEAQLASILGHEIGHYIRRHGIQGLEDQVAKSDFSIVVALVGASMGVPVAGDVVSLLLTGSFYSFSRDNEREADLIGLHLLAQNGYDTREAAKVWRLLIAEHDPDGENTSTTSFMSTHPSSDERQATLSTLARELQGEGKWGNTYKARFDQIMDPWKHRFMAEEIRLENWESTLRLIDIMEESGTSADKVAFYRGEVYRKRGKDGDEDAEDVADRADDIDRAIEQYNLAVSNKTSISQTYRSLGLAYQTRGKNEEAKRSFMTFLELEPNAKDAKMIEYMINAMGAPAS